GCSLEVVRCACQFKIKYYLLVNRAAITQNQLHETLLTSSHNRHCNVGLFQFARPGESGAATNVTVLSVLQGNAGKTVELHLRSGEKMGGKVSQVSENTVHLSNLTGAEYFDAYVDAKDISAEVVRVTGK